MERLFCMSGHSGAAVSSARAELPDGAHSPRGRPLSGAQFLRVVLTNVRRICDFAGVRTGHGVLLRPVSYAGMAGVTVFYLFSI